MGRDGGPDPAHRPAHRGGHVPVGHRLGGRGGRRHPHDLAVGDALDWWRVEEVEDLHLLRLRAEMRLPGLAWLELSVEDADNDRPTFRQRAIFVPRGLLGQLYWWGISPFHGIVFGGMQRNIAHAAEAPR